MATLTLSGVGGSFDYEQDPRTGQWYTMNGRFRQYATPSQAAQLNQMNELRFGSGTSGLQSGELQNLATNLQTQDQVSSDLNTKLLADLEKEYADVPNFLRQNYGDAARRAGTYSNTSEFQVGLDSDVQAGARGARVGLTNRINALRRALGQPEFTPGPDSPMSSGGEEPVPALDKDAPAPAAPEVGEDGAMESADKTNAVTSVTSTETEEERKKRLAAMARASSGLSSLSGMSI